MNIRRIIGLLLFLSVFVFAESGWAAEITISEWLFALSIPILIILLILRLFINTTELIYFTLAVMLATYMTNAKRNYVDKHTPSINHYFEEPYRYGRYEGNDTIPETNNINVMFLHNSLNGNYPNFLDDNNTVYMASNLSNRKFDSIHLKYDLDIKTDSEMPKVYIDHLNNAATFITLDKDILVVDQNQSLSTLVVYKEIKHENPTNQPNYQYSEELTQKYRTKYEKTPRDFIYRADETFDRLQLKDIQKNIRQPSDVTVWIDPNKKELRLANLHRSEIFHPYKVPYTPEMAVYDRASDTVFVVYKEIKGIYVLKNIVAKDYYAIQEIITHTMDALLHPWWKTPHYDTLTISKKEAKKLEKILSSKIHGQYHYHIRLGHNRAKVVANLTPYDQNKQVIVFIMKKDKNWMIDKIIYDTHSEKIEGTIGEKPDASQHLNTTPIIRYYYSELIDKLKEFISANDRYGLFEARVKYGLALKCIETQSYMDNELNGTLYDYKGSALQTIFSEQYSHKNFLMNIAKLQEYEKTFNFNIIDRTSDEIIQDSDKEVCQKHLSIDKMYDLFLQRYFAHGYSGLWLKEIQEKYPSYFMELKRIKDEQYVLKKKKLEEEKRLKKIESKKRNKRDRYEIFKKEYADVNQTLQTGIDQKKKNELLFYAVWRGNYLSAELLIQNGADMYALDENKRVTPFGEGLIQWDWGYEIAEVFIKYGVDINYRYQMRETPLTLATKGCRNPKLVKLLLDHGADPYLMDEYGFNTVTGLFRYCKQDKNYEIIMEMLTNSREQNTTLGKVP